MKKILCAILLLAAVETAYGTSASFTGITFSNRSVRLTYSWPSTYSSFVDIYATTNLVDGPWRLVATNIPTDELEGGEIRDPDALVFDSGFFTLVDVAADSDFDQIPNQRETYIYRTDPNNPDSDGDGLQDGNEVSGSGEQGDIDGFITDPLIPDRVDYLLPDMNVMTPGVGHQDIDGFFPPVGTEPPNSGAPEVSEWIRMASGGDTMTLSAEALSVHTGTEEGKDTHFLVYGAASRGGFLKTADIQRQDGRLAAVTLPERLPTDSMYLMWARSANGYSRPIAINRTEAWWIGLNPIMPGRPFSVFGRNLTLDGSACLVYIEELDLWLQSTSQNPYKADFVLPGGEAPGTYTVWVHNRSGGEYGWSAPLELMVREPIAFNDDPASWIDVTQDPYNAKGDGSTDDWEAITRAFDDCGEYGTVYFPAGTYLVGLRVDNIDTRKRLLGDGEDLSIITSHPNYAGNASDGMIHDGLDEVVFEKLKISAGNTLPGVLMYCRSTTYCRFTDSSFSQENSLIFQSLIDVANGENMLFDNCEFILNQNIYFGSAFGLFFIDCDFYGRMDVGKLLGADGSKNVCVINCTGQSYDNSDVTDGTGWCRGRFLNGNGRNGAHRNFYVAENTTTDLCPRYDPAFDKYNQPTDQNSGEQIMFEFLFSDYRGNVIASDSDYTVQCEGLTDDRSDLMITIVEGRGFGQARLISSVDTGTGTVTITEPWNVRPDSGSRVIIGKFGSRFAIYKNRLDGNERATDPYELINGSGASYTNYTASTGVSLYGGFYETVIQSNRITDTRVGIYNTSLGEQNEDVGAAVVQPNYFNLFTDNSISNVLEGVIDAYLSFHGDAVEDTAIAGTVWRGNEVKSITGYSFSALTEDPNAKLETIVLDHNQFEGGLWGARDLDTVNNLILVGNTLSGDSVEGYVGIEFADNQLPVVRRTSVTGYDPDISGTPPGGQLVVPVSVVEFTDVYTNTSLLVWNSGTDSFTWDAESSASWLLVSQGSGAVDPDGDDGVLTFSADLSAAPAGNSEAVISIETDNGQTRDVVVYLER